MNEPAQPTTSDGFSAAGPDEIAPGEGELIVNLEGFEGPLDLLLSLARDQKVDLRRISMVALVDQYLAHVAQARRVRRPPHAAPAGRRAPDGPGDGRRAAMAVAPPRGDAGGGRAADGPSAARQGYLFARPARRRHRTAPRRVGREALRPARRLRPSAEAEGCRYLSDRAHAVLLGRGSGRAAGAHAGHRPRLAGAL